MKTISEFIGKEIETEEYKVREPKQEVMTSVYSLIRNKLDKLFIQNNEYSLNKEKININSLPNSVYILQISRNNGERFSYKILKE